LFSCTQKSAHQRLFVGLGDFLFKHLEGSPRTIKGVLHPDRSIAVLQSVKTGKKALT
jgi:hypothetical protein